MADRTADNLAPAGTHALAPRSDAAAPRHLPGLDGLRALACLAVFGVHWHQMTGRGFTFGWFDSHRLLENGNTGVALFFMLSGFLLALPFWAAPRRAAAPCLSWRYGLRRLARIVPAYYACLLVILLAGRHFTSPTAALDAALHFAFLHNCAEFSFYSLNDPFWTVAVQMQFYLLLPLVLTALRPWRSRPLVGFGLCLALAGTCYGLQFWIMRTIAPELVARTPPSLIAADGAVLSRSILAHLPHFVLGVALGILHLAMAGRRSGRRPSWSFDLGFFTALTVILVIAGTPLDDMLNVPYGRYNFPVVPALIGMLILCAPFMRSRILVHAPLRRLGMISYGVYLYHLPCMKLIDRIMTRWAWDPPAHPVLFAIAGLAVSVVAAALSHRFLERPILDAVHRRTAGRAARGQAD